MQKDKVFEVDFWPQFRDADADAVVGLRGIMNYFQDVTSHQMYELKFGNYIIRNKYNKVWFITKYKLHINKRIDFSDKMLTMKSWIEEQSSPVLMYQSFSVCRGEEVFAYGRVELCLIDIDTKKLSKLSSIEYPNEYATKTAFEDIKFEKIRKGINKELGKYSYTHTVRYNDIDQTNHMNNLAYVSMIVNAFDTKFFEKIEVKSFEIHYISQCFEGDEIKVYHELIGDRLYVFGEKSNGEVAIKCEMIIKNKGSF